MRARIVFVRHALGYYDQVYFALVLCNELSTVKKRKKRVDGTKAALNRSALEIPRSSNSNM